MAAGIHRVGLHRIAFVRSGDKGDDADVSLFARTEDAYAVLVEQVSAERVRDLYGDMVTGAVTRYPVPNVWALKFLLRGALAGGGPSSLRADNLGKSLGAAILRLQVDVDQSVLDAVGDVAAPADPYHGQPWVIRNSP